MIETYGFQCQRTILQKDIGFNPCEEKIWSLRPRPPRCRSLWPPFPVSRQWRKRWKPFVFFVFFQGRSLGGGFHLPNNLHQEVKHQSFSPRRFGVSWSNLSCAYFFKGGWNHQLEAIGYFWNGGLFWCRLLGGLSQWSRKVHLAQLRESVNFKSCSWRCLFPWYVEKNCLSNMMMS